LTGLASLLRLSVRAAGPKVVAVTIGDVTATVACDNAASAEPSSTVLNAARGNGGATILVRPDWATLGGRFAGTVAAVRFHGPHTDHHLDTPAGAVIVRAAGPAKVAAGDRVTWSLRRCWLV
jgi:hypothetical protein